MISEPEWRLSEIYFVKKNIEIEQKNGKTDHFSDIDTTQCIFKDSILSLYNGDKKFN